MGLINVYYCTIMEINSQGRGMLCFVTPNALWFQGYFIDSEGSHFGLMGVEKPIDEWYAASKNQILYC